MKSLEWVGSTLYSGDLYGSLYAIDPVYGTHSLIGSTGFALYSLAYDGTTLYGSGGNVDGDAFFSIDPASGNATLISHIDNMISSMTYYNGVLYGADLYSNSIYSIDASTGTKTPIGSGQYDIHAMTIIDGVLYGNTREYLPSEPYAEPYDIYFTIDMNTGEHDTFTSFGTSGTPYAPLQGMVSMSPTVVPEPISSSLFIAGGVVMGLRRFRKKLLG